MQRVKELDSIRGLAALTIVIYHLWFPTVGVFGLAVDLFFVLSGYLITTIILDNALTEGFLVSFYVRRSLRIWPVYYLTLLAVVLINALLPVSENLGDLPFYLTYTQELAHCCMGREPSFPLAFRHTWSLAIEEQFYILWPVMIWIGGRRALFTMALGSIALAVISRACGVNHFILLTRCDGLALGGLLAGLIGGRPGPHRLPSHRQIRFTTLSLASRLVWFLSRCYVSE